MFQGIRTTGRTLKRHRLLLAVALTLIILPPAAAYASTVQTYRQSANEVGGQWHTTSPVYANRDFNRVYHKSGTQWGLAYCDSVTGCCPYAFGTANPWVDPRGGGVYQEAWCYNVNDNSGVNWTCQTTIP